MVRDEFGTGAKGRVPHNHPSKVLSGIALCVLHPSHKAAYSTSCYAHVGRAIREGLVHDNDEIILLGWNEQSHHGIVCRDKQVIVDSLGAGGQFDYDNGIYKVPGRQLGTDGIITVAKISLLEFKACFNAQTLADVPAEATYPEPVG
jgi:hypothetical protein